MPDLYRLLARELPSELQSKRHRCLVLRDPTMNGATEPKPLGDELPMKPPPPETGAGELTFKEGYLLRWLHGLGGDGSVKTMRIEGVRLDGLQRVQLTTSRDGTAQGEARFVYTDSDGTRLGLFESLPKLWSDEALPLGSTDAAEVKNEITRMVDAFCCSQRLHFTGPVPKANDEAASPDAPPETKNSPLLGPVSLIQAYLDDRPLDVQAQAGIDASGLPGPLSLAALSGYVFDVVGPPTQVAPVRISFDEGVDTLEVQASHDGRKLDLPLIVEQESEGMYLRVDWPLVPDALTGALGDWKKMSNDGFAAGASPTQKQINDVSDHTLVVRRSFGDAPAFSDDALARSPLLVWVREEMGNAPPADDGAAASSRGNPSRYLYIDRMETRQFVGKLVHYQVEVRNVLDQTVASGMVSVRRLRLDPPPMPAQATATLMLDASGRQTVRIDVELPKGEEGLVPVVWFQRRPLDACGFFGTDDDMALEEGLRQADLNFEEDADGTEPTDWEGHPVSRYLRGAYDRHGLEQLELAEKAFGLFKEEKQPVLQAAEKGKVEEKPPPVLRCELSDAEFDQLCTLHATAARLYVGLRRPRDPAIPLGRADRVVESVLRPCEHQLKVVAHAARRIFQIERLPERPGKNLEHPAMDVDLLGREHIALHWTIAGKVDPDPSDYVWKDGAPGAPDPNLATGLRVRFPALVDERGQRPGGFRVWVRDVVGRDAPDFELAGAFEALPPQVYRYRPYHVDSAKRLKAQGPARSQEKLPALKLKTADASVLAERFQALEIGLRNLPGRPRLVRAAVQEKRQEEIPDKEKTANADMQKQAQDAWTTLKVDEERARLVLSELLPHLPSTDPPAKTWEDVLKAIQAEFDKPVNTWDSWACDVLSNWKLVAPFVDWAYGHGLARDIVLPLDYALARDLDSLRAALVGLSDLHGFSCFVLAVVPPSFAALPRSGDDDRLLATVRICLVPPESFLPPLADATTTRTPGYGDVLRCALQYLVANTVMIYREIDFHPELLAFDDAGVCTLDWNGPADGWRHQMECVVERLDRYTLVNTLWADKTSELPPLETQNAAVITEASRAAQKIRRLTVPRRMPPPGPPPLRVVPGVGQVAFSIGDVPERVAAAHNLLMRVRSGRITRIVEFDYCLPWVQRYKALGCRVGETAEPPAAEPKPAEGRWMGSAALTWSADDEDHVELLDPLFFARYRLRVRHRADRIDLKESVAGAVWPEAQCAPDPASLRRPGVPKLTPKLVTEVIDGAPAATKISIPMVTLQHLLTAAQEEAAKARYCLPEGWLELPDLETRYSLLYVKDKQLPALTVAEITLPNYSGSTAEDLPTAEKQPKWQVHPMLDASMAEATVTAVEWNPDTSVLVITLSDGWPKPQKDSLQVLITRGAAWVRKEVIL